MLVSLKLDKKKPSLALGLLYSSSPGVFIAAINFTFQRSRFGIKKLIMTNIGWLINFTGNLLTIA